MKTSALPEEVLVQIFGRLDLGSLNACQLTCRAFRSLFTSSSNLQYFMELQASSMIDNPRCRLPIAEKLSRLRCRNRRWASLSPDSTDLHRLPFVGLGVHECADGWYFEAEAPYRVGTKIHGLNLRQSKNLSMAQDLDFAQSMPWTMQYELREPIIDMGVSVLENDLLGVLTSPQ
jgi:hypothetical protein